VIASIPPPPSAAVEPQPSLPRFGSTKLRQEACCQSRTREEINIDRVAGEGVGRPVSPPSGMALQLLGEPRVNVLELNLDLDATYPL
jgi:hypothetical protein